MTLSRCSFESWANCTYGKEDQTPYLPVWSAVSGTWTSFSFWVSFHNVGQFSNRSSLLHVEKLASCYRKQTVFWYILFCFEITTPNCLFAATKTKVILGNFFRQFAVCSFGGFDNKADTFRNSFWHLWIENFHRENRKKTFGFWKKTENFTK